MKTYFSLCQNCCYKYHPVMLTTYISMPYARCDKCGYKPDRVAMTYIETIETEQLDNQIEKEVICCK